MLPVTAVAFRQCKARHRLQSRGQCQRRQGPQPWRRADVSFAAHEQAPSTLGKGNGFHSVSIGVAYDYGTSRMLRSKIARSLGMSNVEVVTCARSSLSCCAPHRHVPRAGELRDGEAKQHLWEISCEEGLCDVARCPSPPRRASPAGLHRLPRSSSHGCFPTSLRRATCSASSSPAACLRQGRPRGPRSTRCTTTALSLSSVSTSVNGDPRSTKPQPVGASVQSLE